MYKERKLIIAGNWKMNKTASEAESLVKDLLLELRDLKDVDVVLCPPNTALYAVSQLVLDTNVRLGAQDMSQHTHGAYTGDVCANMLKEFSTRYVILGHSERRQYHNESDELISLKAKAAHESTLRPIICVGETLEQREANETHAVVEAQLKGCLATLDAEMMRNTIIAYEPVWAIGTGKTATSEQAQDVHQFIRKTVAGLYDGDTAKFLRIQYGGSVKPANSKELMSQPDIDGALVGGASLEARSFIDIVKSCLDC